MQRAQSLTSLGVGLYFGAPGSTQALVLNVVLSGSTDCLTGTAAYAATRKIYRNCPKSLSVNIMKISKYDPKHEDDILSAIREDADWDMFSNDAAIEFYRKSLKNDVTYVCYNKNEFCGYLRAILDDGFAVYISELYVILKWRNHKISQSLLERVKSDFSNLTVYALSDEDAYYVRKGYTKIGSVFEL